MRQKATSSIADHENNIRNVRGTLAIEGMTLSQEAYADLERIASGEVSYQQVLQELVDKYKR